MTSHTIRTSRNEEPVASVSTTAASYNRPHLDIGLWLKTLELTQYRTLFEQKFGGVEDLLDFTGRDVLDLGVKNGAHRKSLVFSLAILKEKYNKSFTNSIKTLDSNMNRLIEPKDDDRFNENYNGTMEFKRSNVSLINNQNNHKTSTSSDDIREHCWYHGNVGRAKAEAMVLYNGQFLVRDCISTPGNYVLTCNWEGRSVHFMINRVILNRKATCERIVYQFEDEQYSSVPALIRAYVSERKPVTHDSMCIISEPVNRTNPLGDIVENFNQQIKSLENVDYSTYMKFRQPQARTTLLIQNRQAENETKFNKSNDNLTIPIITSPSIRTRPLPPVPLSHRVLMQEAQRSLTHKWNSESALENVLSTTINNNNVKKMHSFGSARNLPDSLMSPKRIVAINFEETVQEEPLNSSCFELPPKPTRAPSLKRGNKPAVIVKNKQGTFKEICEIDDDDNEGDYHEYCDIDYEDIPIKRPDSGVPRSPDKILFRNSSNFSPPPLPRRVINSNDRDSACVMDMGFYDRPNPLCTPLKPLTVKIPSRICLSDFTCDLLPDDVKPLDSRVWPEIKDLILGVSSHRLAAGITREDYKFLNVSMDNGTDYGFGVTSGLLLLLLPQGDQIRSDILERSRSWKYFIMTTLVNASSLNERTEILAKWIDICRELKESCKNYYGFGNVMSALCSTQVTAITKCWQKLRTDFTELAVIFETQLRSNYSDIQKCDENMNSVTDLCIPDVEPVARLLSTKQADLSWLYDWEDLDVEFGLEAFWKRLSGCRRWQHNLESLCKRMAKVFDSETDTTLTEFSTVFFRSEFQMKFLWGSKGAFVESFERYPKFDKLINLMVEKCQLESITQV